METTEKRVLPRTGYPRRRAVNACLLCRERKRKCDNIRPACSACQNYGVACEYVKHDVSTFDAASLRILEQLSALEGLVRDIHGAPALNLSTSDVISVQRMVPEAVSLKAVDAFLDREGGVSTLKLDASFQAATDRILEWPVCRQQLLHQNQFKYTDFHGKAVYTYLSDHLTQNETSAPHPSSAFARTSLLAIDISTEQTDIERLVDQFFKRVNIKNPLLTRQAAKGYCQQYYEHGPLFNLETCLVLLMCALGAVTMEFDPIETVQSPGSLHHTLPNQANLRLASCYFTAAEKRLGPAMFNASTIAIQCLCLAGFYQMYLVRPIHALRMFHAAGSSLQIWLSTSTHAAQGTSQLYSSLFWACYKSEREILTELPIITPALREPESSDSYPPPPQAARIASDEWAANEEDSWYFFLSEIALRRITDQVSEMVSKHFDMNEDHNRFQSIEDLIPIVAELERQALTFREHLPPNINFPDVPQLADTEWQHYSRGRYYRALELMHRPFLFAAIHEPSCSSVIQELAEKGLLNALRYLQHSYMRHRHHGTWLQLRNMLREASILLAGSKAAALRMPDGWEAGITKALATFDYWSQEFEPCKTYTGVLVALAGALPMETGENNAMI